MKKLLLVFNPYSGKGKITNYLVEIVNILTRGGYQVTTYPTKGPKDAYRYLLKNEKDFDLVVCSGGDGTLNEVVAAILKNGRNTPLGYIPSGTVNDWASNLGIPSDMLEAARVIVEGKPVKFDIGKFDGKLNFNYVAAFGSFTDISYATSQSLKKIIGQTAYGVTAIKRISHISPYHVRLKHDNGLLEGDYYACLVCNTKFVGKFKLSGMHSDLHDGKFDIILIKKIKSPFYISNLIKAMITQDYLDNNAVDLIKSKKVDISIEEPQKWTIDGEYGGCIKDVSLEVIPSAVSFVIRDKEPEVVSKRVAKKKMR